MRQRVVIIGLGDTGLLSAVRLVDDAEVIAISPTNGMVSGQDMGFRIARPKAWASTAVIPFSRYENLDKVRIIHGRATRVEADVRTVVVEHADGEREAVPYDALLIASGTRSGFWRSPQVQQLSTVESQLLATADRFRQAASVAIIGGGPSGVSAASQLKRAHPQMQVALYFSRDQVLPGYHPGTRTDVQRRLEADGVELYPRHRANVPNDVGDGLTTTAVSWQGGQPETHADLVLWTIGQRTPNTGFMPPSLLDDEGYVRVDATLQIPGEIGIFAVGDVASTDPNRSSARNEGHEVVSHNIRCFLQSKPHAMKPMTSLPIYRWGSVFGPQKEGLRVYFANGWALTFWPWLTEWLLFRLIVGKILFRGIRDFNPSYFRSSKP